ncbi:hypothetical protein EIP86_002339 [Pleurotus ostreatoroseus]|nr:hypothetical protein EIP86_002339 [Pleurotus ostreatoroseus]
MNVQNLVAFDPFADEGDPLDANKDVGSQANYIHIRIQQRNGRKTLTTLQGLPKEYDAKKLLKAFKKVSLVPFVMRAVWTRLCADCMRFRNSLATVLL